jgi:SAM-dependent methyltransferase
MARDVHDHAIRGRFHAWFLSRTEDLLHRLHGERKRRLFGELPRRVVEIGPGTGANFRYYPAGTEVVAVEPNLRMHERLREAAARHQVGLELRGAKGEGLDVETGSVEAVVATFVLCSVDDPARVLDEARRVLAPGGRLVFLEHVAAPAGTALRRVQDWVQPPWTWWFEGCRPNRDTGEALARAGFSQLALERFEISGPMLHVRPHIAGVAVR